MTLLESVQDLARGLERARTGDGSTQEVVEWLRASSARALDVTIPRPQASARGYTRTLLHRCETFEILMLHWDAGARTDIHDHGGALCWFSVARGCVGVENFDLIGSGQGTLKSDGRAQLGTGEIDYRQDDVHLHRCFTAEPSVSLHVYARPIERFNVFDERSGARRTITSTYDVVAGV